VDALEQAWTDIRAASAAWMTGQRHWALAGTSDRVRRSKRRQAWCGRSAGEAALLLELSSERVRQSLPSGLISGRLVGRMWFTTRERCWRTRDRPAADAILGLFTNLTKNPILCKVSSNVASTRTRRSSWRSRSRHELRRAPGPLDDNGAAAGKRKLEQLIHLTAFRSEHRPDGEVFSRFFAAHSV
jgi:hypothetical protein